MSHPMSRPMSRPITSRPRRLLAGLALAPLALGLVACGSDDSDEAASPGETVTVTEDGTSTTPSPSDGSSAAGSTGGTGSAGSTGDEAGLLAAAETALGATTGTLTTVDRDDNGWDVTVVTADGTESDADISSDGATIERGPSTDDNDAGDRAEQQRLVDAASVDYLAAIEAARGSAGGGSLVGVDLDEDNGSVEWDVDFTDGTQETTVTVDATDASMVRTDQDRDDDGDGDGD